MVECQNKLLEIEDKVRNAHEMIRRKTDFLDKSKKDRELKKKETLLSILKQVLAVLSETEKNLVNEMKSDSFDLTRKLEDILSEVKILKRSSDYSGPEELVGKLMEDIRSLEQDVENLDIPHFLSSLELSISDVTVNDKDRCIDRLCDSVYPKSPVINPRGMTMSFCQSKNDKKIGISISSLHPELLRKDTTLRKLILRIETCKPDSVGNGSMTELERTSVKEKLDKKSAYFDDQSSIVVEVTIPKFYTRFYVSLHGCNIVGSPLQGDFACQSSHPSRADQTQFNISVFDKSGLDSSDLASLDMTARQARHHHQATPGRRAVSRQPAMSTLMEMPTIEQLHNSRSPPPPSSPVELCQAEQPRLSQLPSKASAYITSDHPGEVAPFSPSCGGAPSSTLRRGTAASAQLSAALARIEQQPLGQAESILASSRDMSGPATGAEVVEQVLRSLAASEDRATRRSQPTAQADISDPAIISCSAITTTKPTNASCFDAFLAGAANTHNQTGDFFKDPEMINASKAPSPTSAKLWIQEYKEDSAWQQSSEERVEVIEGTIHLPGESAAEENNKSILPLGKDSPNSSAELSQTMWGDDTNRPEKPWSFRTGSLQQEAVYTSQHLTAGARRGPQTCLESPACIAFISSLNLFLVSEPEHNRIGVYEGLDFKFFSWLGYSQSKSSNGRTSYNYPTSMLYLENETLVILQKDSIDFFYVDFNGGETTVYPVHQIKGEYHGLTKGLKNEIYTVQVARYKKSFPRIQIILRKMEHRYVMYMKPGTPMYKMTGKKVINTVQNFNSWEEMAKPRFLTFSPSVGKAVITDAGLHKLYDVDLEDSSERSSGYLGGGAGQLDRPTGLLVDTAGNLLVADSNNHRLVVYDRDLKPIRTICDDEQLLHLPNDLLRVGRFIYCVRMASIGKSGVVKLKMKTEDESLSPNKKSVFIEKGDA